MKMMEQEKEKRRILGSHSTLCLRRLKQNSDIIEYTNILDTILIPQVADHPSYCVCLLKVFKISYGTSFT
jgi:hypothetical protein